MTRPLKVVAVSGSLQRPSRTQVLVEHLLELIGDAVPIETRLVELGVVGPQLSGALHRSQLPLAVEAEVAAVEQADLLVVASPVYRASYSGLFKHFFDFVHADALVDVPVLLAATGGSERHALVIDHQLRPLFSFFQARTLPIGVYATDKDFVDYRITSEVLRQRAALAVARALPLIGLPAAPAAVAASAVATA